MDKITDVLFLSDYEAATNHAKPQEILDHYKSMNIEHHHIHCYDSPYENIDRYFEQVQKITSSCKTPILFHCMSGISRSPTLLLSHLCTSIDLATAYNIVRTKRRIHPNEGFEKQLRKWCEKHGTLFAKKD